MGLIVRTAYIADTTILAALANANENVVIVEFNGNINNDNIADDAAIAQTKISNVVRAIDALKVGGYQIQTTPTANSILPLDANGKIVGTVIKDHTIGLDQLETDLLAQQMQVWDSGWFAVAINTTYTKDHSLGKLPKFIQILIAENADGSGWCVEGPRCALTTNAQAEMVAYSVTQIKIRTGPSYLATFYNEAGALQSPTSGYCRIVIMG